ncbi:glycosyltransferase family 2 protein [Pontibacter sp. HSC-14F20]|uniref:glycosyltransferase family 2 protein n=1 Tax=Pontibacter sp. HSC-14F20 TaxID=2864136 RepID=UPI001C7329E0|nr:glycosyltransferase family A protein [Pontibacter sp. HSC-14F20]MBX0333244.1 glycosyltransferase family 2 protein [Pontibacter sp. HSC-14F20]
MSFSVIVPVHNKGVHLERSINSILNQTEKNFELIIINDASTDGSAEIIENLKDSRILKLNRSTPGPGGYAARNMGIEASTREWICFLDADDEWDDSLLYNLKTCISQNGNAEFIAWDWLKVRGDEKVRVTLPIDDQQEYSLFSLTDFLLNRMVWTGAVAIKKEVIKTAGMFPYDRCKRGGDLDTWIRCLWKSKCNIWIHKALSIYYTDSVNMVTKTTISDFPCTYLTLENLLKQSPSPQLASAIKKFQNSSIYSVLDRNIKAGKAIDYKLMSKFKPSILASNFILKLHVKRFLSFLN